MKLWLSALIACGWSATALASPISDARQLTFEGRRAGEGYFSADGARMIFQSERQADNPFYQIYMLDLETGDIDRLSAGVGKTTCAWLHPDGRRALFASTQFDPEAKRKMQAEIEFRASGQTRRYSWDYDPSFDIVATDIEAGGYTRLTTEQGYDAEGAYSPDGSKIVFASNRRAYATELSEEDRERLERDPSYFMELYVMDADGSNVRRLTDAPGYDGGPFWSADGSKITWRRFSEDGARAEIYTMNADGSGGQRLTDLGVLSWAPYFHPSGEYLIFATNLHGFANFELYLVDAAGRVSRCESPTARASTACRPSARTGAGSAGPRTPRRRSRARFSSRTGTMRRRSRCWPARRCAAQAHRRRREPKRPSSPTICGAM